MAARALVNERFQTDPERSFMQDMGFEPAAVPRSMSQILHNTAQSTSLPDATSTSLLFAGPERVHWSVPKVRRRMEPRGRSSTNLAGTAATEQEEMDLQDALRASQASLDAAAVCTLQQALCESRALAEAEDNRADRRLQRIDEAERRCLQDVEAGQHSAQLTALMVSLRTIHPSIVSGIQNMAGVTKKFEYLRQCFCSDDREAMQTIYAELSDEDRDDLERAYHLSDGEREPFFLDLVADDRRQRMKLGDVPQASSPVIPAVVPDQS